MFKSAFSTIACPDWTLDRVARLAAETGYTGVELRTFGYNSSMIACDPALTAPEKVRRMFKSHGVELSCLATGVTFDEPVRPALIGRIIGDPDRPIRLAKAAIDLATQLECPSVRVFGFEIPENESVGSAKHRIVERLALVADAARHTGVTVVLENGGTFTEAEDLIGLIDAVGSPLLGAAYGVATAWVDGEDPAQGIAMLGDRLTNVKLRDFAGTPRRYCLPGEGGVPCEQAVRTLIERGYRGWVTVEWDRLWCPELEPAERTLPEAARRLYAWVAASRSAAGVARATARA
ncbi:sugar phosphate isomerase/epimerase [Leptolyngbya sp. 15MV]|nr:sugar phosphate isomerase/epimerase [Leptolyngbya sp. 15MV]